MKDTSSYMHCKLETAKVKLSCLTLTGLFLGFLQPCTQAFVSLASLQKNPFPFLFEQEEDGDDDEDGDEDEWKLVTTC